MRPATRAVRAVRLTPTDPDSPGAKIRPTIRAQRLKLTPSCADSTAAENVGSLDSSWNDGLHHRLKREFQQVAATQCDDQGSQRAGVRLSMPAQGPFRHGNAATIATTMLE